VELPGRAGGNPVPSCAHAQSNAPRWPCTPVLLHYTGYFVFARYNVRDACSVVKSATWQRAARSPLHALLFCLNVLDAAHARVGHCAANNQDSKKSNGLRAGAQRA
jgi:hypothetical protein